MKITNDVYYCGALNPNLRVFDIIMSTEYGTSYNSYLVKGSEKNAIIEACHIDYFDNYLENIKQFINIEDIDYLILNHTEPDHTGSVAKLLELNPNIKVILSQAGSIYIKNITNNSNMDITVAKDGDVIELGNKTLKFISAPFLHWPDSMFTYLEQDKVLFSCDFLGSHYCEPQILDTKIKFLDPYKTALKGYYDAIFGPFKPYVLKGLDKIKNLDIEFACNSHGPVLTKKGLYDYVIEQYEKWSKPLEKTNKQIPIFYCSAYGNTEAIGNSIAEGIREVIPSADVKCYNIIENDMIELSQLLNDSDAFLLGSPTLNRDAVAPVWSLLSHIDAVNIQKRPVALFGSYGWSGEAINNLTQRLNSLKVNLFEDSFRVVFVPSQEDLKNAKEFGKKFAQSI